MPSLWKQIASDSNKGMEFVGMIKMSVVSNIAEVVVDNPPVNALSQAVRAGLLEAVAAAAANPDVSAIVIRCEGRTFFAGADISEFGKPPLSPSLPEVIAAIENTGKPVVAAIHGNALGGGLEVALGCHYRVALGNARFGLPEVKLGLVPGAGGTQRLPRLVGVATALSLIIDGTPIPAAKALDIGLIDRLFEPDADLAEEARRFAREAIGRPLPLPFGQRTDKIDVARADPNFFARFRQDNARRLKGLEAPEACIRAVQAAVELPIEEGLKLERALFLDLVAGDQSRAQRHVFFAERAAAKIDDIPADTPLLPIRRVGIIGAGTMGTGIAMNFLSAGIPVTLVERDDAMLQRGCGLIRKNYESSAKRGRLTTRQVEDAVAFLTSSLSFDELAGCDLVIEAAFELMAVKKDIFRRLDAVVAPGAILATNTSYLNVDEIAAVTQRPESVVGMHFFSPANIMKLLEVVRGAKTAASVLKTVMDIGRRIGKVAVISGVCHGFIGNRMLAQRQSQAMQLVVEGALPWEVDQVLLDFGMPMGPFQMTDLAGLDLGWTRETSTGSTLREVLCEADRRGQKNGRGFYDYDEKRNRMPSPDVIAMIEAFRAKRGVQPRAISADEIHERLLYPMINEGVLILEEGIAQRSSDIDLVWINGYGWPVQTGGPMFWAETIGHDTIVAGLDRWAAYLGDSFRIAPSLLAKAQQGLEDA